MTGYTSIVSLFRLWHFIKSIRSVSLPFQSALGMRCLQKWPKNAAISLSAANRLIFEKFEIRTLLSKSRATLWWYLYLNKMATLYRLRRLQFALNRKLIQRWINAEHELCSLFIQLNFSWINSIRFNWRLNENELINNNKMSTENVSAAIIFWLKRFVALIWSVWIWGVTEFLLNFQKFEKRTLLKIHLATLQT